MCLCELDFRRAGFLRFAFFIVISLFELARAVVSLEWRGTL